MPNLHTATVQVTVAELPELVAVLEQYPQLMADTQQSDKGDTHRNIVVWPAYDTFPAALELVGFLRDVAAIQHGVFAK